MHKPISNAPGKKEKDSEALAKGKNNFDFANALFSTADDFLMEFGIINGTYNNKIKNSEKKTD